MTIYVVEMLNRLGAWVPTVGMHLSKFEADEDLRLRWSAIKGDFRVVKYARIGR